MHQVQFLKPPKMLPCPCCGFIPAPQPKAVHRDGELVELTSRIAVSASSTAERGFYGELDRSQQTRGYKAGWAAHKFKEKFGHFPPFAWNYQPPPSAVGCDAPMGAVPHHRLGEGATAKGRRRRMSKRKTRAGFRRSSPSTKR